MRRLCCLNLNVLVISMNESFFASRSWCFKQKPSRYHRSNERIDWEHSRAHIIMSELCKRPSLFLYADSSVCTMYYVLVRMSIVSICYCIFISTSTVWLRIVLHRICRIGIFITMTSISINFITINNLVVFFEVLLLDEAPSCGAQITCLLRYFILVVLRKPSQHSSTISKAAFT